ncbi:hypothetical protein [Streptomyces sp. NPDC017524]|uniref:hypothetical protein n=1 Tax=unclassified Streptomyces TaxID=2593676 RepID=UPI0037B36775
MNRSFFHLPVVKGLAVGGGVAASWSWALGAPWWVIPIGMSLTVLLPQESAHRRDVYRDVLRHRERMVELRRERIE